MANAHPIALPPGNNIHGLKGAINPDKILSDLNNTSDIQVLINHHAPYALAYLISLMRSYSRKIKEETRVKIATYLVDKKLEMDAPKPIIPDIDLILINYGQINQVKPVDEPIKHTDITEVIDVTSEKV